MIIIRLRGMYENDGSQSFTAHDISTSAISAVSVFAIDLDGDGDNDVLSASATDDKFSWCENNGTNTFIEHVCHHHNCRWCTMCVCNRYEWRWQH